MSAEQPVKSSNRKIPRTMSTQHPDNVTIPFFANNAVLRGDDEIKEAYYAFSNLGVEEIMWDAEGKESDGFVIRKLITDYENFFHTNVMGKDVFITVRVPNPDYEKAEAKILLETLESIPRSYDTAQIFYKNADVSPIFEVIVPMADEKIINKIHHYYRNVVIGKEKQKFIKGSSTTVGEWIGEFCPKTINVLPLFEDIDAMLDVGNTVKSFLKGKEDIKYQRVFLARSDPAMNVSSVAVILTLHMALESLAQVESETGIAIHPILGCGTAPFRGNFSPRTYQHVLDRYPSVSTYTIQSAFKYDFPVQEVQKAISDINAAPVGTPHPVENKEKLLKIIRKLSAEYRRQVSALAPLINEVAKFVPSRRMRKLHTGLFGYSRELGGGGGVKLPRVISFCAALYSIGLPPDLLGLNALNAEELDLVRTMYPGLDRSLYDTLSMWNPDVLDILPRQVRSDIQASVAKFDHVVNKEYRTVSSSLIKRIKNKSFDSQLTDLITRTGYLRGFLG